MNKQNADGSTGAVVQFYAYRGDGKRAWKQAATGGVRTYFYYDGDTLIGSQSEAAGNASGVYLWGADGLIGTQSRNSAGVVSSSYNLYDAQGNLAQRVSGTGVVSPVASYTAWGEVVPRADGTKPGGGGYGAKYGYLFDGESGFYLCTYRHYDPSAGRWITRDPIGYKGGSNLYGYVDNDPVSATDPSGLVKVQVIFKPVMGSAPAYHAYILVWDTKNGKTVGTPKFFRGGYQSQYKGNGRGRIQVQYGNFLPGTVDYNGFNCEGKRITFLDDDKISSKDIINRLKDLSDQIQGFQIPYFGVITNSNSVAYTLIAEGLGIYPMNYGNAPVMTSGWGENFYRPNYTWNPF